MADLLGLSSAELWDKIQSSAPAAGGPNARTFAQAKAVLDSYHAKLTGLGASTKADAVMTNRVQAGDDLTMEAKKALTQLGGTRTQANITAETRVDWRGGEWDLSKRG
jgi:hypothetical protein